MTSLSQGAVPCALGIAAGLSVSVSRSGDWWPRGGFWRAASSARVLDCLPPRRFCAFYEVREYQCFMLFVVDQSFNMRHCLLFLSALLRIFKSPHAFYPTVEL